MNKAFKKLTMQMKVNLMTQILNKEMNMKDSKMKIINYKMKLIETEMNQKRSIVDLAKLN